MKRTTHLENQVTAVVGHIRDTDDFAWNHRVAKRVLDAIEQHEEKCMYCATGRTPLDGNGHAGPGGEL